LRALCLSRRRDAARNQDISGVEPLSEAEVLSGTEPLLSVRCYWKGVPLAAEIRTAEAIASGAQAGGAQQSDMRSLGKAKKLGLVRFWLVLMATSVIINVLALTFFAGKNQQISFDDLLIYADVVCAGVSVWLLVKRKRAARVFICTYCVVIALVGFTGDILVNQQAVSWQLFINHGRGISLACFAYFFAARRAKQVLTVPLDTSAYAIEIRNEHLIFQIRRRDFWRDVVMYFIVFSVVGHWMEIAYSTFARYVLGIYDSTAPMWQSLFAPFTIYGVGMVICVLLLYPLKMVLDEKLKHTSLVLPLSFVANTVACTALELGVGLALNVPDASGHLIYWDYSNIPLNFMGQICLQNSLAFGMVATLMVWVLYPALECFVLARPRDGVNMVFAAIVTVYLMLAAAYIVNPYLIGFNLTS
jgi:uncharacterized membrane protein